MKALSSKYPALTSNPSEQTSNPVTGLNDGRPEPQVGQQRQTPTSWPWLPLVPADWLQLALARVTLERCDGPFGSSIKSEHYADEGIRVVRLQNIGMAAYKGQDSAFLDEAHVRDEIGYAHDVLPDDLLIAGLGDENNPLGRACVAPSDLGPTIVKADCYRFRLDTSKVEPAFVALQLSALAQAECGFIATGSTRQRLNLGLAAARRLVLPPTLERQRHIVAWLDRETARIDALVEKKTRFIELLREKRQALITQAVTQGLDPTVLMKDSGVEWLGQVPAHWSVKPLKLLVKPGSSVTYGIVQPGDALDDGVPFIQTTNMTSGDLAREQLQKTSPEIEAAYPRSRLVGGEVVLGIRASIGAAHLVPPGLAGVNLSRGVARIDCSTELMPAYLLQYLRSQSVDSYWELSKQGSTFNEVSIATVRELPVPVPPANEQASIVDIATRGVSRIAGLIEQTHRSTQLLVERRAALITAAVTGQIDLREAA